MRGLTFIKRGLNYFLTVRLERDPIERNFSKYKQMRDNRFFVNLREVKMSFWDEDVCINNN